LVITITSEVKKSNNVRFFNQSQIYAGIGKSKNIEAKYSEKEIRRILQLDFAVYPY